MRSLALILGMAFAGLAAGVAAGLRVAPAPPPAEEGPEAAPTVPETEREVARLSNQFVVPVVEDGRLRALVIASLSVEVAAGMSGAVFEREPRLRDAFLQVFFDHANVGGFSGNFTGEPALGALRRALRETASRVLGPVALDVLILDLVRQDY